ncbi:MAG: hypothetical protein JWM33_244 [Caulobacteraceae bacterium]|nr:hypothetical protein [Caulobacteraceae bacterium]
MASPRRPRYRRRMNKPLPKGSGYAIGAVLGLAQGAVLAFVLHSPGLIATGLPTGMTIGYAIEAASKRRRSGP